MKKQVVPRLVAVAMVSLAVGACDAGEQDLKSVDLQLKITDEASAADVGLPKYPGAKPYKDAGESSSGANVGLSAGTLGFKVVALDLASTDRPQQVAAFYRKALAKYGTVLDCSDGESGSKSQSNGELACDSDDPGSHSIVYKVGTDKNQRIVAIDPHGDGTKFSLVHLDMRGTSKR